MQTPPSEENEVGRTGVPQYPAHQPTQATDQDAFEATIQPIKDTPEHEGEGEGGDTATPTIGYRTEYRSLSTDDLMYEQYGTTGFDEHEDPLQQAKGTVFEIVRRFFTSEKNRTIDTVPTRSWIPPTISMRILSVDIINALRSVVKYYPGQDLLGDEVHIRYPYPILVHHYDELSEYRQQCARKDPSELCVREKNAEDHLRVLLDFLDKEIMPEVRKEQKRNRRGFETWEYMWVSHKPGSTRLQKLVEDTEWTPTVIQSLSGGSFDSFSEDWTITYWSLDWDGTYLGRRVSTCDTPKWDGENKTIDTSRILPMVDYWNLPDDPIANELVEFGKKWWGLLRKQCGHFRGKTRKFPYNEGGFYIAVHQRHHANFTLQIDGAVMADLKKYFTLYPNDIPDIDSALDSRIWTTDCVCPVCLERRRDSNNEIAAPFSRYDTTTLEDRDELTPHEYFLCPVEMPVFFFKTRSWGEPARTPDVMGC